MIILPKSASSGSRSQAHFPSLFKRIHNIFVRWKDKTHYLSIVTWAMCYHSRNKLKKKTLHGGPYIYFIPFKEYIATQTFSDPYYWFLFLFLGLWPSLSHHVYCLLILCMSRGTYCLKSIDFLDIFSWQFYSKRTPFLVHQIQF